MAKVSISLFNAVKSSPNKEMATLNFKRDTRDRIRDDVSVNVVVHDVVGGDYPSTYKPDGIIVTDSSVSVYDTDEWVERLYRTVDSSIDAGIPILGVGFGHQLVADVLGAEVVSGDKLQLGYRTFETSQQSPLLYGIPNQFAAFSNHQEYVKTQSLPVGVSSIVSKGNQTYALESDAVFGVQFHPEFDARTAMYTVKSQDDISEAKKNEALETITESNKSKSANIGRVLKNFCGTVHGNANQSTST